MLLACGRLPGLEGTGCTLCAARTHHQLSRSLDLCVRRPGPCSVVCVGVQKPEWASGPHMWQRGRPVGPPPLLPAWPSAHLPCPVPSQPDCPPDSCGLILSPHPVLCLLPPPPSRPAQFTDGRYWIYSPRHRRLRAVTLSSSGTVSDHGRPPGSPAPAPRPGSREPQVLACPPPLRRVLWLSLAALAHIGCRAAGLSW